MRQPGPGGQRLGRADSPGSYADVFLWRSGRVHGYAVAMWKHGHVAEPTQLSAEQAAGFWLETLRAGAAVERHLRPVKLNYLTLGNALPHLHTHIVPRYADDPVPGRPFPFDFLDNGRQPEERLQADVLDLRAMVGADNRLIGGHQTCRLGASGEDCGSGLAAGEFC